MAISKARCTLLWTPIYSSISIPRRTIQSRYYSHRYCSYRSYSVPSDQSASPSPHSLDILFCGSDRFSIPSLRSLVKISAHNQSCASAIECEGGNRNTSGDRLDSSELERVSPPTSTQSKLQFQSKSQPPPIIRSITVLCRTPKPFWKRTKEQPQDRGIKLKTNVPIEQVALDLGLKVYHVDTLDEIESRVNDDGYHGNNSGLSSDREGWKDQKFDLIVASSFGLKIPARMIEDSRFGGVNVHPSMLPDLRGSSPLQHTLLLHRPFSGLTIQTLHPTKIDAGQIISQTEYPGIPIHPTTTITSLTDQLAVVGADMLVTCVKEGSFIGLQKDGIVEHDDLQGNAATVAIPESRPRRGWASDQANREHFEATVGETAFAPKITIQDRRIDWATWSATNVLNRQQVLGDLWDEEVYSKCYYGGSNTDSFTKTDPSIPPSSSSSPSTSTSPSKLRLRVIFHGWKIIHPTKQIPPATLNLDPGIPFLIRLPESKKVHLAFRTTDEGIIIPTSTTIETRKIGVGLIKLIEMMGLAGAKPVTVSLD